MADLLSGLVHNVTAIPVGTQLAAPAAIGATVLTVDDAAYLSPTGGQVTIGTSVVAYVASDDDADTITLASALTAALAESDFLFVYPPRVEVTAMVLVGGSSVPIPATVPWDKQDALLPGVREEEDREKVTLRRDGEFSWAVADLPDLPLARDSAYIRSPYVAAYKTSDTLWPNNSWTTLTGLTVTDREEIVYVGNGVFQIVSDGLYECSVGVRFAINGTGARAVRMAYTRNAVVTTSRVNRIAAVSGEQTTVETTQKRRLIPGDTVEFQAYQDSTAQLNLFGAESGTVSTDVTILKVSP